MNLRINSDSTQIAYAIVLGGFYSGYLGGGVRSDPQIANLHSLVMATSLFWRLWREFISCALPAKHNHDHNFS